MFIKNSINLNNMITTDNFKCTTNVTPILFHHSENENHINMIMKMLNECEIYNPNLALFTSLAKKYNHNGAIMCPEWWLLRFETEFLSGRITGANKAEKMANYLSRYKKVDHRTVLMKTIFGKHKLTFCDEVMTFYNEWVQTYTFTGKINRYIKMNKFVTIHTTLFIS